MKTSQRMATLSYRPRMNEANERLAKHIYGTPGSGSTFSVDPRHPCHEPPRRAAERGPSSTAGWGGNRTPPAKRPRNDFVGHRHVQTTCNFDDQLYQPALCGFVGSCFHRRARMDTPRCDDSTGPGRAHTITRAFVLLECLSEAMSQPRPAAIPDTPWPVGEELQQRKPRKTSFSACSFLKKRTTDAATAGSPGYGAFPNLLSVHGVIALFSGHSSPTVSPPTIPLQQLMGPSCQHSANFPPLPFTWESPCHHNR